jgi:hypothetical protein
LCAAVNASYTYKSNTTGHGYLLSTAAAEFAAAEGYCNSKGGHLVSYSNETEQQEVERFFFDYGVLLPGYHTFYWLGLSTNDTLWPAFSYIDGLPAPNATTGTYANWGNYSDPLDVMIENGTEPEPNNWLLPPENCAGANYTQLGFDGSSSGPWPWADTNCSQSWPFMCKMLREWPAGVNTVPVRAWCMARRTMLRAPRCLLTPSPPQPLPTAAFQITNFTNNASITFVFNNTPSTQYDAQTSCNLLGGNLAWFASRNEQREAENGFIALGRLMPTFHKAYWIGLRSQQPSNNPADYKWLDRTGGAVAYQAWGYYVGGPGGGDGPEPDNRNGQEACGAGNFTEARNNASAWADASCGLRLPFMCRLMGGSLVAPAPAASDA